MKSVIYIHPRPHHHDECCAVPALVLALGKTMDDVEVKEISYQEASSKILLEHEYMVDVGGRCNNKQYFDHHQLDNNISAFGIICDAFESLKVLRKSTIRKYVDSVDTRGRTATLADMGINGSWKDKFEIFPDLIMVTNKLDKGNFKSLVRMYEYFKWVVEWDKKAKELNALNSIYYEFNNEVISVEGSNVLRLMSINPDTNTTGGVKQLLKKYKAEFMIYPGKFDEGLILVQCGKTAITKIMADKIGSQLSMKPKRINNSLYQFRSTDENKL